MPKSLHRLKILAFGIVLSVLYELKIQGASELPPVIRTVVLLLGSWIAIELSAYLLSWILGWQILRRLLFSGDWVEGVWHVRTFDAESEELTADGIAIFKYVGGDLKPDVNIEKPRGKAAEHPTSTHSKLASVEGRRYINVFEYTENAEMKEGVAIGKFSLDDKPYPTAYDGRYVLIDDSTAKRQIGRKIGQKEVRRFRKEYGQDWKRQLLRARSEESSGGV